MLQKWWCPSINHNLKFLTHWKCVRMLHRALLLHGLCAVLHCTLLSSKTWVSGHFMIISYFLRSLHLPPYFLENIYVLWQTNTFLRTYKYEILLYLLPSLPSHLTDMPLLMIQESHCPCFFLSSTGVETTFLFPEPYPLRLVSNPA